MKVFLTGGTGFIGQRLTQHLLEEGIKVKAYVRSPSQALEILPEETEIVEGELLDFENLQTAMTGCDAVIHLAAFSKVWHHDMSIYKHINIDATLGMLEAAVMVSINKFIFISSAGVLGPTKDKNPISENDNLPTTFFTEYDRTKSVAETLVLSYADRIQTVVLNITRVFGPGLIRNSNSVTQLLIKYRQGKWRILPGKGDKYGNYVLIDDVVESIKTALSIKKTGERYILGGENLTFKELFGYFEDLTGKSYAMLPTPTWLAHLYGLFEITKARITNQTPVMTPNFARRYIHDWMFSSEKAQRELGHKSTPVLQALKMTLDWLEKM